MDKLAFVDVGELGWSLYLSGYLRWLKANKPATLCVLTLKDRFCLYENIADLLIEVKPNPFGSKYPQDGLGFRKINTGAMREYYDKKLPKGYKIPDYMTFNCSRFFDGKMIFKPYNTKNVLSNKKDTILIFSRHRKGRHYSYRNIPKKFYINLVKEISKEFPGYNIVCIGSKDGAYSLDIKLSSFKNIVGQTDIQDVIDYCNISVAAIGSASSLPKISLLQKVPTFVIGHERERVIDTDNWLKTKVGFFEVDKKGYNSLGRNNCVRKMIRIFKADKKRYNNSDGDECISQIMNFVKEATGDKAKQKIKLNIGCGEKHMVRINPNPIFILGASKSGTTLLTSLLDGHSALFVVPVESHFFQYVTGHWVDYALRRVGPVEYNHKQLKARIIQSARLIKQDTAPGGGPTYANLDIDRFRSYIRDKQVSDLQGLFSLYMGAWYYAVVGKEIDSTLRIVEKSVENAEYADVLRLLFPRCRFIHIVRNPYANLVALRRYKTKRSYPYLFRPVASLYNSYYYLLKNQMTLDNYLVVKYEDIVSNSKTVMQKIADFAQIEYTESLLRPTLNSEPWPGNSSSGKSFAGISTVPLTKWKEDIKPLEIHMVNSFAKPIIEKYGYEYITIPRSRLFPVWGEGIGTYLKNRSLFSIYKMQGRNRE